MTKPLPVIDGDAGCVDVYGHARTAAGAMRVARKWFADGVARVERCGPVKLRDGTTVADAWLAISGEYENDRLP